ncbi:hypothetical protein M2317_002921 [Microbacterium sp. ZKA21]|uniref:HK97 gp10 family phage protein n=1 Tax=Microbacterium sp. ZKA21 TaxID=3381694 RepID=UPI003D19B05C
MGVRASVQFTSRLGEVTAEVLAAAQHGVNLAAEELLKQAVLRAPMNQGDLRNSGGVSMSLAARGGEPEADVVFNVPYAARLHEHPEYDFATDANPNAQGKYLENAALENKDQLGEVIAAQIRRAGG